MIGVVGVKKLPWRLRLKIFSVVKADQPDVLYSTLLFTCLVAVKMKNRRLSLEEHQIAT